MRVKDVELQLAETMEQCENDDSALAMQVNELETELKRAKNNTSVSGTQQHLHHVRNYSTCLITYVVTETVCLGMVIMGYDCL